jgi:arginyl-tRNA synthetase
MQAPRAGFEEPPSQEFGQYASSVAFELAKTLKMKPAEVAKAIADRIDIGGFDLLHRVQPAGSGYVNFYLNFDKATREILLDAVTGGEEYGFERVAEPKRIVVEHTSANPSGPLHLGHARNTFIGDALARILKRRGHTVQRRFYIDDVGKQVAMLAYGYSLLGAPKPEEKPDQWLGFLYACTNCIVEIETLKTEIAKAGQQKDSEAKVLELTEELDDWTGVAGDLKSIDATLYQRTAKAVRSRTDPMTEVEQIVSRYEKGDPETKQLVRAVAGLSLDGIRETLGQVDVTFDEWDWESDLVWSSEVQNAMQRLASTPYAISEASSLALDVDKIARTYGLDKTLGFAPDYEVPRLTLVRSDGTTLYVTRDIAYSLRKAQDSDLVINVIGSEQKLAQLQLKLALYALGAKDVAESLVHYAYGIVELPGLKMSKRRARYISFDEIVEQAVLRARDKISARDEPLGEKERAEISRAIGLAAIRYAVLSVSSVKTITFTWDRILSLERNSAPFINYAYTRTRGIIAKAGEVGSEPDYCALTHQLEQLLVLEIGNFPAVFAAAADNLRPEDIAAYANVLAEKFHEYYEKVNVLRAGTSALRAARLMLIRALRVVLANSMRALGIEMSERM